MHRNICAKNQTKNRLPNCYNTIMDSYRGKNRMYNLIDWYSLAYEYKKVVCNAQIGYIFILPYCDICFTDYSRRV